jgi:hypothetical protein
MDYAMPEASLPAFGLCQCLSSAARRKGSDSYTVEKLRIAIQVVFAFFLPLGCIHRRQLRSSPMSLPRFSREDPSVKLGGTSPYLHLNYLPRWSLPSRLLVEPPALWLARLLEAPEDHNCRFISCVFSTDPMAGSDCVLSHRQLVSLVVFFS